MQKYRGQKTPIFMVNDFRRSEFTAKLPGGTVVVTNIPAIESLDSKHQDFDHRDDKDERFGLESREIEGHTQELDFVRV